MAYRGLTAIGANYLATRLAQELPVEITRVQIGAGTPVGNPGDVSELQNYKLDAKILKKSQENNTLEITIQVVNEDVDQGFYLKEIGVFVNDDTEKLYWYCNEDNAQYIPAKTDSAIAFEIDIKMEVTNIESPIMNWSGKGTWIDKDYLEEVLKNHVVNNLTEQSATKALAANQGVVLDNKDVGIMGGRDGKFPLTAATKGNIYLLESTQKYYICINDYDGIQISVPNANFEELSVYTNRSKLDNLFENSSYILETKTNEYGTSTKYINGILTFKPKITGTSFSGTYPIPFKILETVGGTYACFNGNSQFPDEVTYAFYPDRSISFTNNEKFRLFSQKLTGSGDGIFKGDNQLNLVLFSGRWK